MKEKLQIKLISPRMSLRPMDTEMKRRLSPPLSLVTIASMTPPPHSVYIEDENVGALNLNDSPDLVGVTVSVDTVYRAIEIAKHYREKGVQVIFGGIHASAVPEEMLPYCDAVCVGEAEELWPKIIDDCCAGALKTLYHQTTPTNLSLVPLPNWNYINKKKYLYYNVIVAGRGCPFKCEFCYNSSEYVAGKYRARPVDDVIEEIDRMGVRQVMFIDDNLIGDIHWLQSLLDRLENKKIVWHAAVSTNIVHQPELINRMAKCGCKSLFIGFESINADSIKSVKKTQNKISEYETLISLLHSVGIMVNASLVFGFDSDTPDTFDNTLHWLVKNKVETMTGHILTPYPGTVLYKRLKSEGRIICDDLRKYNTSHVVFQPQQLTVKQLQEGYVKMYREFYSLRNIVNRIPTNKKLRSAYLLFNFFYRKYGKAVSLIGRMGFMNALGSLARRLSYGI